MSSGSSSIRAKGNFSRLRRSIELRFRTRSMVGASGMVNYLLCGIGAEVASGNNAPNAHRVDSVSHVGEGVGEGFSPSSDVWRVHTARAKALAFALIHTGFHRATGAQVATTQHEQVLRRRGRPASGE